METEISRDNQGKSETSEEIKVFCNEHTPEWKRIDYKHLENKKSNTIVLLGNDNSLKKEWNEKGLYWFNNIFDYNNRNELKDQILSPLENFWSDLRWHSWSYSYDKESAKSYLWTPSIDDNYKLYQRKRKVKSSITKDMNISYKFCSWLERFCGSVVKLIVEKGGINCKDLLLIGLNINACGKSGLAFHKDTCTNNGYGEVIVNLILSGVGFVVLPESKTGNAPKYGIWLGAGDCYVISDSSRFEYFHKVTTAAAKAKNVARERCCVKCGVQT